MLISEIINKLEKIKEVVGDVKGYTTGYYDTNEVDEIRVIPHTGRGICLDDCNHCEFDCKSNPDSINAVVFLPGNFP